MKFRKVVTALCATTLSVELAYQPAFSQMGAARQSKPVSVQSVPHGQSLMSGHAGAGVKFNRFFARYNNALPHEVNIQTPASNQSDGAKPTELHHGFLIGASAELAETPTVATSKTANSSKLKNTNNNGNANNDNKTNTAASQSAQGSSKSQNQAASQSGKSQNATSAKSTKATSQQIQAYNSTIDSNWATWTASNNGVMTLQQIQSLLPSPNITPQQAAALEALADQMNEMGIQQYKSTGQYTPITLTLGTNAKGGQVIKDGAGVTVKVNTSAMAKNYSGIDNKLSTDQAGAQAKSVTKFVQNKLALFQINQAMWQNWSTWTATTGGVMTLQQVDTLLQSPGLSTQQEEALGALAAELNEMAVQEYQQTGQYSPSSLTLGKNGSIENGTSGSTVKVDNSTMATNYDSAAKAKSLTDFIQNKLALFQLNQTLMQNWATWTAGNNGVMTLQQIETNLQNPSTSPQQAAALEALAEQINDMGIQQYEKYQQNPQNGQYNPVTLKIGNGQTLLVDATSGDSAQVQSSGMAKNYTSDTNKLDKGSASAITKYINNRLATYQLNQTLMQNWTTWTGSPTGTMSAQQLASLMAQQPPVTGPEACALAALAIQMNGMESAAYTAWTKAGSSGTFSQVSFTLGAQKGSLDLGNGTAGDKGTPSRSNMAKWYTTAMNQLSMDVNLNPNGTFSSFNLYGSGGINISDIVQWRTEDCFFVSSVEAFIAAFGPNAVQNMIAQVPGNPCQFAVRLPGYANSPVFVTLTPAQAAMFNYNTNGGVWLAVMGMAFNQALSQGGGTSYVSTMPFGGLQQGGHNTNVLPLLTGETFSGFTVSNQPQLNNILQSVVNSSGQITQPIGLSTDKHDLSITNYYSGSSPSVLPSSANYVGPPNAAGPYVTVQNPWGSSIHYNAWSDHDGKDPTQGKESYKVQMVKGAFTIPVADLAEYGLMWIQTPQTTTPQTATIYTQPYSVASLVSSVKSQVQNDTQQISTDNTQISTDNTQISSDTAQVTKFQNSKNETTKEKKEVKSDKKQIASDQTQVSTDQQQVSQLNNQITQDNQLSQNLSSIPAHQPSDIGITTHNQPTPAHQPSDIGSTIQNQSSAAQPSNSGNIAQNQSSAAQAGNTVSASQKQLSAVYEMQPGSMFVLHNTPVTMKTTDSSVNIARGAGAFMVQVGPDVAVYNLTGTQPRAVQVKVGSRTQEVPIGQVLILSRTSNNFSGCPLSKCVDTNNAVSLGNEGATNLFRANFSYQSALDNCPQFLQFVKSSDPAQRRTAKLLLKLASANN